MQPRGEHGHRKLTIRSNRIGERGIAGRGIESMD